MAEHEHPEGLADEALLRSMRENCAECFALLFHRYFRQVFATAYKILRDRSEAEDVLQEVFLSIYLQQEQFDPSRGTVRTWVLQFAYFKALLRRRYLRIRNFYSQEEITESREIRNARPAEVLGMSPAEWSRYVEAGIIALGPKQRRVIELVHFEGYTLREAMEIMRETLANTRNYYYRGLKTLRTFLNSRLEGKQAEKSVVLENHETYSFES